MSVVAAIRPDDWNFPLFVHVLGAMILVGGLLTGVTVLAFARGDVPRSSPRVLDAARGRPSRRYDSHADRRRVDLREGACGELPEGVDEPAWIGIGYIIADVGPLLHAHRADPGRHRRASPSRRQGDRLAQATMILALIVLAAAVVAVWAMSGKPDESSCIPRGS